MDAPARLTARGFPFLTVLVCAAAAAASAVPLLNHTLIYDRAAVAGGEWWRLLSGHLVHHSPAHFAYDALAFFVVGALVEARGRADFALLCLVAAVTIGTALDAMLPSMAYYGGLSGVVTAAVVYLCLIATAEGRVARLLSGVGLAAIAVKLGIEIGAGATLFVPADPSVFTPVPMSHAIGALSGLGFWLVRVFCVPWTKSVRGADAGLRRAAASFVLPKAAIFPRIRRTSLPSIRRLQ